MKARVIHHGHQEIAQRARNKWFQIDNKGKVSGSLWKMARVIKTKLETSCEIVGLLRKFLKQKRVGLFICFYDSGVVNL